MRKNLVITLTVAAMALSSLAGCGKVDMNLRSNNVAAQNTQKEFDFSAHTYLTLDDFMLDKEAKAALKQIKIDDLDQIPTLMITADYDKLEYRYTYDKKVATDSKALDRARIKLENAVTDHQKDYRLEAESILQSVSLERIYVIVSFWDKDGTELYTRKMEYATSK